MEQNKITPARQKVIDIALSYVGQMEVPAGSNWGAFVQACLALVGINFAASWCMAFAYRCYNEACSLVGIPNTIPKTGGCINAWNKATNKLPKSKLTAASFIPGAIYIYDHGKGLGHAVIGISCDALGNFQTVEGNSNSDGSRNGIGVFHLNKRHLNDAELLGCIW